jgi:predicted acylesterase/phospholipase RssA
MFRNEQIHADVLLASACLPLMHQAVEIDGDAYWDGGFSGNPLLTPIVRESPIRDTLLVKINPIEQLGMPKTARAISSTGCTRSPSTRVSRRNCAVSQCSSDYWRTRAVSNT